MLDAGILCGVLPLLDDDDSVDGLLMSPLRHARKDKEEYSCGLIVELYKKVILLVLVAWIRAHTRGAAAVPHTPSTGSRLLPSGRIEAYSGCMVDLAGKRLLASIS